MDEYWYRCSGYQGIIRPHAYKSKTQLLEPDRELCNDCKIFHLEELTEQLVEERLRAIALGQRP